MRWPVVALVAAVLFSVVAVPSVASAASGPCTVTSGDLDWGLKRDFRDYITGPVAAGSWREDGSASFHSRASGDYFRWPSASGTVTQESGTGLVGFIGSVSFIGHAGGVTRTFANPELQFVRPGLAYLLVDVSGVKSDGTKVNSPGVQFAQLTLPTGALDTTSPTLTVSDVPATLTDPGEAVFSRYPAGTALDPVSFTLRFSSACSARASATPTATTGAAGPVPSGLLPWLVLALGVVAIVVLLGLVLTRRGRMSEGDE